MYPPSKRNKKPKFKVCDTVSLQKYKVFFNGYKHVYTTEVFRIKEVSSDSYYYLVAMEGEDILGTIYEQDMVKYVPTQCDFRILFSCYTLKGHILRSGERGMVQTFQFLYYSHPYPKIIPGVNAL